MNRKHFFTTSALLATSLFSFVACYSWYEEKVPMDTDTPQTSLSEFFYEEKPVTSLTAPTQVIASQGLYSGSIKVSWSEVPNASSYRIERAVIIPDSNGTYAEPDDSNFEIIEKYSYKNTYEDKILSNPTSTNDEYTYKYYYRICAENIKKGYESSDYTDITEEGTEGLGWLLPAPTNIQAWKGKSTNQIKISWTGVANAVSYLIYRGQNENGTGMEQIASVVGNQTSYLNDIYTSEQGTEFYYKVYAKLASGSTSAASSLALGYSLKAGAPNPPSNIQVVNGFATSTSSITLSWDEVTPPEKTTATRTYSVYYTTSIDSVYTIVKSNIERTTTSLTISEKLKSGLLYYFYVQTIEEDNGEKNKSTFSETGPEDEDGNANPNQVVGFLLSAPSDIELVDSTTSGKIYLRWTPAIGQDIILKNNSSSYFSYNIYYDDSQDGSFDNVAKENLSASTLTLGDDKYYQYELDKHNFFKIATKNGTLLSSKSTAVAPTPSAPGSVKVTKNSNLGGLSNFTANTNGIYPVKISWTAPSDETPAGYNIYRATASDGAFKKINDSVISSSTFSYIDSNETARPGTYYYYKVVSLNVLGQGKKGNSQDSDSRGYGAITREQWFKEYNKTIMSSQAKLTLMHKSGNTAKLGTETINGDISGTLYYNAAVSGVSGVVTMLYTDYADTYINDDEDEDIYFCLNGNTNTKAGMDTNGNMYGTTQVTGMYPGTAVYDHLEIKKGAAGGGYYLVTTYADNSHSTTNLEEAQVDWKVGEDH